MMYTLLHIFFAFLFVYLSVIVLYLFILAIAGRIRKKQKSNFVDAHTRIAVLITSYNEDKIIVDTVSAAVAHNYPKNKFDVFVAADHMKPSTIEQLQRTGATVYEMHFERGSKARSLNFLLNNINESNYDFALVLDGDNIMQDGFLNKINAEIQRGAKVVQAHRTAKNLNTPVAVLDALSEEVNNHLFRSGPAHLGLSSSLIGSGMAFPIKTLTDVYNKPGILDNPACDREVDFEMLVNGYKIHYLPDALVLDEKVASKNIYKNQRRRWLESQWMHIRLFFSDGSRVHKSRKDFWHKFFITLMPPRLFMFATFCLVLMIVAIQAIFQIPVTGIAPTWWIILFSTYLISILLAIPPHFYNRTTLHAIYYLPLLLFQFIAALFGVRKNRKDFVHTPKTYTHGSASTNDRQ